MANSHYNVSAGYEPHHYGIKLTFSKPWFQQGTDLWTILPQSSPKDWSSMVHQNVGILPHHYMVSQLRIPQYESLLLGNPQIYQVCLNIYFVIFVFLSFHSHLCTISVRYILNWVGDSGNSWCTPWLISMYIINCYSPGSDVSSQGLNLLFCCLHMYFLLLTVIYLGQFCLSLCQIVSFLSWPFSLPNIHQSY